MGELLNTAIGFPTMLFTAALIIAAAFWLPVLCGGAERDGFASDVDAEALRLAPLVTRRLVRPLSKLFPDEPGLPRQGGVAPSGPPERG